MREFDIGENLLRRLGYSYPHVARPAFFTVARKRNRD